MVQQRLGKVDVKFQDLKDHQVLTQMRLTNRQVPPGHKYGPAAALAAAAGPTKKKPDPWRGRVSVSIGRLCGG